MLHAHYELMVLRDEEDAGSVVYTQLQLLVS
jgi:hypothetical protein